jgi:hypothetical protein
MNPFFKKKFAVYLYSTHGGGQRGTSPQPSSNDTQAPGLHRRSGTPYAVNPSSTPNRHIHRYTLSPIHHTVTGGGRQLPRGHTVEKLHPPVLQVALELDCLIAKRVFCPTDATLTNVNELLVPVICVTHLCIST